MKRDSEVNARCLKGIGYRNHLTALFRCPFASNAPHTRAWAHRGRTLLPAPMGFFVTNNNHKRESASIGSNSLR